MAKRHHIQFKVDDDVVERLEAVQDAAQREGADHVSLNSVARSLMLSSLYYEEREAVALEVLLVSYRVNWRVRQRLQALFDKNIKKIIEEELSDADVVE